MSTSETAYNNYLKTNIINDSSYLSTFYVRYNNTLGKYEPTNGFELFSDALRYRNDLSKYKTSYDLSIENVSYNNYLVKSSGDVVTDITTAELRYNNTLEKYSHTIDVSAAKYGYDNYIKNIAEPEISYASNDTLIYSNNLEKYTSNSISISEITKKRSNYLVNVNHEIEPSINIDVSNSKFSYENSINYSSLSYDISLDYVKTNNSYLSSAYVLPIEEKEVDISEFRYKATNDKTQSFDTVLRDRPLKNNTYAILKNLYTDYSDADISEFEYKNYDLKSALNHSFDVSSSRRLRYDNTFVNTVEVNNTPSSISYTTVEVSTFRYDNNNISKFKRNISVNTDTPVKLSKPLYTNSTKSFDYSASIDGDSIYSHKASKQIVTPLYKDELKFTDIETRFTIRGPVSYDLYGSDVKVVPMTNNKEGFAWEQEFKATHTITKDLQKDNSFETYKPKPIVVTSSPIVSRENQMLYYAGRNPLLKMNAVDATYSVSGYSFPLAAPRNATLKGIMRPTASVAIEKSVHRVYEDIDFETVVPVFDETGDRVSLFSDRFFLQ